MKKMITVSFLAAFMAFTGCNQGTSGGPGAAEPGSEKATIGQTDETFSLEVPMLATKINQGETAELSIGIKRGRNMKGDVTLEFAELPKGVMLKPANPAIKREGTEAKLTLVAADDASLGDFTVTVTGRPTKGPNASNVLKLSVVKGEDTAAEAAKAEREEYARETRKLLNELDAKYEELVARVENTEGQAKKDLETKLAQAKEKRDVAARKLEELQVASADRWDKVKEGVENAFEDLKTMFE